MATVTVRVAPRANFDGTAYPGYGAAGVYWSNGETTKEVSEEQLAELQRLSKAGAPFLLTVHPAPSASTPPPKK